MAKKCIECNKEARYLIKGTSEYYCGECAVEEFGDVNLLVAVEEEAQALKKALAPQELEHEQTD